MPACIVIVKSEKYLDRSLMRDDSILSWTSLFATELYMVVDTAENYFILSTNSLRLLL